MFINLLPEKLVIKMLVRRRLRQWALVWAALLIAGIVVMAGNYREVQQSQLQLDALTSEIQPLQQLQAQTASLDSRLNVLQREVEVLESICVPDRSLALLAVLGNAAKSSRGKVQIERMHLSSSANREAAKKSTATTPPGYLCTVSLQGVTDGDQSLASFVESLRNSQVFHQVELKSSLMYQIDETHGRQFQIECKFAESPGT
ncbi:PilN domain-containing protein [Novipirellula caenicola]|uniref:Fimbrial assembly protein (PilN) n=1 Tax=Novipirellula caenicola TaxID=1536901 RepID=A0ABP9VTT4_9BACT